jgi:phosphopantothenoylcysteine decarboxylase/phosphopantothenate--cysteine ligase
MNREMWAHPATQRNLAQVQADGAQVLGVGNGSQACGETGDGRMLEPEEIMEELAAHFTAKSLQGQHLLVTAGPTFEAIDPVRGITNLSSGKMGFAIARARARPGPRSRWWPARASAHAARSDPRRRAVGAPDADAVQSLVAGASIFIATAAVADWRPAEFSDQKIKKDGSGDVPAMDFVENPDILAGVAQSDQARSGKLYCVGFAAESHDLLKHASAKRLRRACRCWWAISAPPPSARTTMPCC